MKNNKIPKEDTQQNKKRIRNSEQKNSLHLWVWLQDVTNIRTVLLLCLFKCHNFWTIQGLKENKPYVNPHRINIYYTLKHFNNSNTQT